MKPVILSCPSQRANDVRAQALASDRTPARPRGTVLCDPVMEALYRTIERIAPTTMTVLVLGETGVGKELIADQIHQSSPRSRRPFLKLNCATLSAPLLESELFGHVRGAFTGAHTTKMGLFESAQGGTVFLDEVGELAPAVQAKLLRVIETRQLTPVGGTRPRAVDVRFIAATNRDLANQSGPPVFRPDLLYRLSAIELRVPPLRERPAEIVPLARHFLEQARQEQGLAPMTFSQEALAALAAQRWPGNVRQLRHTVERAALLAGGKVLTTADLGLLPAGPVVRPANLTTAPAASEPVDPERERLQNALAASAGNQRRAAERLGMSLRTLVRRLDRYGLPRPRLPQRPPLSGRGGE